MKLTPAQIKKIQKIAGRYLYFLYNEKIATVTYAHFMFWLDKHIRVEIFNNGETKTWQALVFHDERNAYFDVIDL